MAGLASEDTLQEVLAALGGGTTVPVADHDAALPDGVSVGGGVGKDTAPAPVGDGDTVRAWLSRIGAQAVMLVSDAGAKIAIKAASTAAAFTDVALVVELRPGGTFPGLGAQTGAGSVSVVPATDAAFGTVGGALDATLTNGTQLAAIRGLANGVTAASTATVENIDADRNATSVTLATKIAGENLTSDVMNTYPLAVAAATGGWATYETPAAGIGTAGVSVKGTAGRVKEYDVTNIHATIGFYACIVDKATAAVNGDTIAHRMWCPPHVGATDAYANRAEKFFGADGIVCALGVSFCASGTPDTVTLIANLSAHGNLEWI